MIRINQIKLPIQHKEEELEASIKKKLRIKDNITYTIVKQSIDARDAKQLFYSYCIEVNEFPGWEKKLKHIIDNKNIMLTKKREYAFHDFVDDTKKRKQLLHSPIIVGTGPAGLFCGYLLAKAGYCPILIERGADVDTRTRQVKEFWEGGDLNTESNVQFGEGGAGTFSDGKLNSMIKDKSGRIHEVLKTFVEFGAHKEILYINKPHIGTDVLVQCVKGMREEIIRLGGQVHFSTKLTSLILENQQLKGIYVEHKQEIFKMECECLILALGHSARDTVKVLFEQGVAMEKKPFAIGLRVQHKAEEINQSQYGDSEDARRLPAADYKLTHKAENGRSVYSFCMCPGGHIVNASSEEQAIAVNGMSYHARDGRYSNSAIVVNVTPDDFPGDSPLAGIEFQRKYERAAYAVGQGRIPLQCFADYEQNTVTHSLEEYEPDIKGQVSYGNLRDCLPNYVNNAIISGINAFEHKIKGFSNPDTLLCGVETRTSSPVKFYRDELFCSNISGLYPCGEGAGYAGGITSAAVDGMKVAEGIASQFLPVRDKEK